MGRACCACDGRPQSKQEVLDKFITAKYKWRGFVVHDPHFIPEDGDMQRQLYSAAAAGDVFGILRCLAMGAELHAMASTHALHLANAGGHTIAAELLRLNSNAPALGDR